MTTITAITEKRIQKMKNNNKFAGCLSYILREIKCSCSCDGATMAELKKLDLKLPNETQI